MLSLELQEYFRVALPHQEFHAAYYPPGTFYKKHLDVFKDRSQSMAPERIFSCVYYCNEEWCPADGGELKLYLQSEALEIPPLFNRLVIFFSGEVPHEVQATSSPRFSLTGWLKSPGHSSDLLLA